MAKAIDERKARQEADNLFTKGSRLIIDIGKNPSDWNARAELDSILDVLRRASARLPYCSDLARRLVAQRDANALVQRYEQLLASMRPHAEDLERLSKEALHLAHAMDDAIRVSTMSKIKSSIHRMRDDIGRS